MKSLRILMPAALVASSALFLGSSNLEAWTLDGNVLSLFDRDFRVFNNFTDPSANDNTVVNNNYPGALGAVQALWKGAAEWASQPMGNGQGDPSQVTIGSGGGNFDPYFAGVATSAGVMGNNIMSELAGARSASVAGPERTVTKVERDWITTLGAVAFCVPSLVTVTRNRMFSPGSTAPLGFDCPVLLPKKIVGSLALPRMSTPVSLGPRISPPATIGTPSATCTLKFKPAMAAPPVTKSRTI